MYLARLLIPAGIVRLILWSRSVVWLRDPPRVFPISLAIASVPGGLVEVGDRTRATVPELQNASNFGLRYNDERSSTDLQKCMSLALHCAKMN
ncbi:hypothetical protein VNO78_01560 [Psophocarpus tetragonolobus]|uniref:Uncharacterized protein n=1 Tax=Psophocarpus tetragonolobus TaxID=3891 RepID=A0AAN9SY17_PSOTE